MLQILDVSCSSSALGAVLGALRKMLQLIQIIVPILLIIGSGINIIRLVHDPEDKKRKKRLLNSVIAAVLVFFIPMFVDAVMGMVGDNYNISSCWKAISSNNGSAVDYVDPYGDRKKSDFIIDPEDYEQGIPKGKDSNLVSRVDDEKYNNYEMIGACESSTLKFKILKVGDGHLVIIWVKNASAQLNGALAAPNTFRRLPAETILTNEINANGYQNKCMVAVNASFFSYSTNSPVSALVVNKGKIVKNEGNAGGCIGVDSNNKLVECSHQDADTIARQGIRNTFGISSRASISQGGPNASRTQICQIDENNFVLISGSGTVSGLANIARNITGCGEVYNLDGGGSRKLYYKRTVSPTPIKIFGGGREVPDMLYFAEQ